MYLAKNDTPHSAAYAKLELPASPWEVWDAMEKVRLQENEELYGNVMTLIIQLPIVNSCKL